MGGGDQPPDKNIPLEKTCKDGSIPIIGIEVEDEKKKVEEKKRHYNSSGPVIQKQPNPIYSNATALMRYSLDTSS